MCTRRLRYEKYMGKAYKKKCSDHLLEQAFFGNITTEETVSGAGFLLKVRRYIPPR